MYDEHPEFRKRKSKSRSGSKPKKSRSKDRMKSKKDKDKKPRKHKSRSRSRSEDKDGRKIKRHGSPNNNNEKGSQSPARGGREKDMNSEERRAMIAKWNDEDSN